MKKNLFIIFCALLMVQVAFTSAPQKMTVETPALPEREAGFYKIDPIDFSFQQQENHMKFQSSTAMVFYSFYAADLVPSRKPLFVFFNGGPGCPTSNQLMSLNTAPYTLDKTRNAGVPVKENPYSWTKMGNLLYIDAPDTGFSYNLMENPSDSQLRQKEFDVQNFNVFIDASQMVRVVLHFLDSYPDLQKNPVVLVGESYGGTRVSTMLNLLINYPAYGYGKKIFQDKELAQEIQKHFDQVDPDNSGKFLSPAQVARQFGRQVLIQPQLTGSYQTDITGELYEQKDSVIYQIATKTGKVYITCDEGAPGFGGKPCIPLYNGLIFVYGAGRDFYTYTNSATAISGLDIYAQSTLLQVQYLNKVLGVDIQKIAGLAAADREKAYRYSLNREADLTFAPADIIPPRANDSGALTVPAQATPTAPVTSNVTGPLDKVLGKLQTWDDYHVGCSKPIYQKFYDNQATQAGFNIDPESPIYGEMFLENLALVDTLLTNSALDLMVYTAALPDTFKKYDTIVADISTVQGDAKDRYGFIDVSFKADAFKDFPTPKTRTIFFPHYDKSGHAVATGQPAELYGDVKEWMTWIAAADR